MAASLATSIFKEAGLDVEVFSAGVSAWGGEPASINAINVMVEENLNLNDHKSQLISQELLSQATLVLTMTRGHLAVIQSACPTARAFTLNEFAGVDGDVCDPFGGDLATYRNCATQIKELIMSCVTKIREECNYGRIRFNN
jgi:protein-tyrosine-phosphatase